MTLYSTLEYLINVGVRLLNFWQISSHYAVVPYPTFINFRGKVHPVQLFSIFLNWNMQNQYKKTIFSNISTQCKIKLLILREILIHLIKSNTLEGNILTYRIMIFEKFPPNTFIPYPTFIILRLNVHPIWLFHTLPLFGTLEYTPWYGRTDVCTDVWTETC